MNDKFVARMKDPNVVSDTRTLADFVQIWCDGHHGDRVRHAPKTEGAQIGIYRRGRLEICDECEAHLAYAEKRRAYCPLDPKPFCAYCEIHCYKPDESEWQRQMMRYSGPKSWRKGHAIDGIKHVIDGRKYRKQAASRVRDAATTVTAPTPVPTNRQEETP